METVADRINRILKDEGIKKTDLAKRLKISDSSVSTMCSGKSNPSGQTITMICKEFCIREEWLKYGEGDMYIKREPEPLDVLLKSREIPEKDLAIVRSVVGAFLELREPSRQEVIRFVESCAAKLNAPPAAADPAPDKDLAVKVDALERQNRELIARLEAIEKDGVERDYESVAGTPTSVAEAEALYEKSLGIAPSIVSSVLNTTGGAASPNDKAKDKIITFRGGGENGNAVG